jgi:CRP/FNR family transcriptional regulator
MTDNTDKRHAHTLFEAARTWHVRHAHLLDNLPPHELAQVNAFLTPMHFNNGEIVCPPDAHHTKLFFLLEGRVKQYTVTQNGDERILHIFRAGDAFGGLLMGDMEEFSPWIQALDAVKVAMMDEANFKQLVHVAPTACMRLFQYVIEHHVEDVKRLERFIHMKARDRLLLTLIDLSQRIGEPSDDLTAIDPPYTHEELGNMLGLVRTTVSELISELKGLGVIDNQGRKLLIDLRRANQLLNG